MLLLLNSIASALLIKFMGVKTFTESTTFQNGILGEFWFYLTSCFVTGFPEIQVLSSIVVVIPRQQSGLFLKP